MVSSDIVAESRSWGEMVRAIDAERRTLPWAQNEFVRNEIITLAEVPCHNNTIEIPCTSLISNTNSRCLSQRKLKDRDIDLFTMAFRDPVRENQRILTQAAADVKLLTLQEEDSRKKYNIINHIGLSKTDRLLIASRKVRDREHDWHPSSHLKNTSPDDRLKSSKMIHIRSKRGSGLDRDFDIVSGKFKVDDDGKQLLIKQQVRDKCEEKFWQTHDYDCIKVKSYDPKLQEKFLKENIAIEKSQGLLQASKFPHW